jgi:hypothetical protein
MLVVDKDVRNSALLGELLQCILDLATVLFVEC